MSRFEAFSSVYEVRRVLRDRLGRMLRPAMEHAPRERPGSFDLCDVDMLELLLHVQISPTDDAITVRAAYDAHRLLHSELPTFDELRDDGWFAVTWGRVTSELSLRTPAREQAEPLRAALLAVLDARRRGTAFAFADISALPEAARALASRLENDPGELRFLSAPSPDWVAARLWERRPAGDDSAALRWWVDRWRILAEAAGSPTRWWSRDDARAWRQAAFNVLQSDPGLVDWDREKEMVDAQLHNEWERADAERRVEWEQLVTPAMPSGLIDRWERVTAPHPDHWERALELCGETWVLVELLCRDLDADRVVDGPSAAELLALVVTRPWLTLLLATRIQRQPALLADVVLHPSTAAWGCLLVADWGARPVGAWERPLQAAEAAEFRERAFADVMSLAAQQLRFGNGSATEIAELLRWLHGKTLAGTDAPRKVSDRTLAVVHSELQSLPREKLKEVLDALSLRELEGLGSARFAAALELAALAGLTDALDANKAVGAYVAGLRSTTVAYSVVGLTPRQASTLAAVAKRSGRWNEFLVPIDVRAEVRAAKAADKNPYTSRDEIAHALRAHIRVLSRAVVGWEGDVPGELVKALADAIRSGSTSHEEKGRVGAFAARYETGFARSRAQPPLIADVGDAYTRLPETLRSGLTDALLSIDEPLTLALFLQRAPNAIRDKLTVRIDALSPEDAASVQSLTEMQGRIEELLNAGSIDAALKYIDAERDLKTLGRVDGRAVVRLRWECRVAFHRREYGRISEITIPDGLQPFEVTEAEDTLSFYRALSELSNPNGDASTAESLFADLALRHPENSAYAINRFAAHLSKLLGRDLFKKLGVEDLPDAREAMSIADRALAQAFGDESQIHEVNYALLLLAMGQNEDAYQRLQHARKKNDSERVAAYSAVALARMGRVDEASAALVASEATHPASEVLKAAREHLNLGTPAHFGVLSVSTDDPVAAIQSALYRLTQVDPGIQARVAERETVEGHLTAEIRSAAASLTSLVPHLHEVHLNEDDITAVLLRILEPRARLFDWSLPDQSNGGYSARGNAGERDLIIRKDGYVISVLEAMICEGNPSTETQQKNLTSHFQKLFGYDQCRVFFHVVYSYFATPRSIVDQMKTIAQSEAPSGFIYDNTVDIPHEDSRPTGFVATFRTEQSGDVKVICLVLDMKQQVQREAAALAGRTLNRRAQRARKKRGTE